MDIESEISKLKQRVGDLEGAVSVLAGQLGKVHPDIINMGEATNRRFDKVDDTVGRVVSRLDTLNSQLWSLRDDMPQLIVAALQDRGKG